MPWAVVWTVACRPSVAVVRVSDVEAPLALYRRYRPEAFGEVIGQDHVTQPLRQALANNRVHHAYLFSGPRGCGKTTSARILARALNCEQGPTPDPCGECESCRDLGRGGGGSLDVIEIDAASHGGVDDARDLRERAFFAPVSSRYKVYIVDEAHMVTPQGFNALLKLVEEPPPHLKFVFATTEPDKVIGTIRSRTHHYPFRLVPPKVLGDYLSQVCEREGVQVDSAVLPLVVRAGAGSVRDSLSVLDQLIGGAGEGGVTYHSAAALLGYTPESLLDEVVDAFAAADGGSVFSVIDKVIESGQDPRRFGEDLLRRLRDLVVIAAVPDAPAKGIIDVPDDQAERLTAQADRFGRADLARAADIVSQGLTEMRGATAPRLLLELVCARVLLPGADDSTEGVHARLDRIERRMTIGGTVSAERPAPAAGSASTARSVPAEEAPAADDAPRREEPAGTPSGGEAPTDAPAEPAEPTEPSGPPAGPVAQPGDEIAARPPEPGPPEPGPPEPGEMEPGQMGVSEVRRLWDDVLDRLAGFRRTTWSLISHNATVVDARDGVLTLGFSTPGIRDTFVSRSDHQEYVRQAMIDVLGVDWRVEAIVEARGSEQPRGRGEARPSASSAPSAPDPHAPDPPGAGAPPEVEPRIKASPETMQRARGAIRPTRNGGASEASAQQQAGSDEDAHPDDPDADEAGLSHDELLARELGARVIEEIPHE
jgi:DNA polymerase III subunit gamma/tau